MNSDRCLQHLTGSHEGMIEAMIEVALAGIKAFRMTAPKDQAPTSEDTLLEIPLDEFKAILADLTTTYNMVAELVGDSAILRGRELARMTATAQSSLKATQSPTEKVLLLNAHTRRLLAKVREALKSRPSSEGGRVIQVCSKIQARAVQIIDYLKTTVQEDPFRRKEVAFDSQQARILFSGKSEEKVSRRDTIRAMKKAEALWPALNCDHRPNDSRQTMRLTAKTEDLKDTPIIEYRDLWQRSGRSIGVSL